MYDAADNWDRIYLIRSYKSHPDQRLFFLIREQNYRFSFSEQVYPAGVSEPVLLCHESSVEPPRKGRTAPKSCNFDAKNIEVQSVLQSILRVFHTVSVSENNSRVSWR